MLAEPAHQGAADGAHPKGRKRRSGQAWELNAKASTREWALEVAKRRDIELRGRLESGLAFVVAKREALGRRVAFELGRASSQRDSHASTKHISNFLCGAGAMGAGRWRLGLVADAGRY